MVDYVKIKVKAGDGGDGHASFRVHKGTPFGVVDGGDGGRGGDVIIVPSFDLNTLSPYRFRKEFEAEKGVNGGLNNRTGANSADLILEVPLGTLVKDQNEQVIYDITLPSDRVLIAKGGKGGRGNVHLKHEIKNRQDEGQKGKISVFEKGFPGEEFNLILELKVLADVGLTGLPNAGKSTLLTKLTAARPKVANYPFTTLEPNLGVFSFKGNEIVIADIPGLIEGASSGKGLGDEFLRHVERTRLLVHLVSLESQNPFQDYKTINQELANYSEKLTELKQIVALSKIDLVDEVRLKEITDQFKKAKVKTLQISSMSDAGIDDLKKEILKKF